MGRVNRVGTFFILRMFSKRILKKIVGKAIRQIKFRQRLF